MNDNMENEMKKASAASEERAGKGGNPFLSGLLVGFLVALVVSSVIYLAMAKRAQLQLVSASSKNHTAETESVMTKTVENKVKLLENSIREYYLEDVDNETLEVGIYKGIVDALDDPYSTYYTSEEMQKLKETTEGVYYGIGAYVGYDQQTERCVLSKIMPGTPAEEAGLKAEDIIMEVDGTDVQGMTTSDVVALIKGEENTQVMLKIFRRTEKDYLDIPVTRGKVETPTVSYEKLDDGVAYIQISQFEDVTAKQFLEAMEQARGDGMKGLLLDLRANPGGTLTSVVDIAQNMLPKGLVVYTEDKYGNRQEYSSDGLHELDVPLVVLVDANSASASEILAGAVKDYGIGTLVGETTFGKGIVQKVFGVTDGSAVKLTTSHYYTPKGNDIHKKGVAPDVEVELDVEKYLDEGIDNQFDRALTILKEKIK